MGEINSKGERRGGL